MRSDRNEIKKKKKRDRFKKVSKFWSVLYLITVISFVVVLIKADLLPQKYLAVALGIVAFVTLITFPVLFIKRFKVSRKRMAMLLSVILMAVYGLGITYLTDTLDFFSNITSISALTENFYVVVKDDSKYEHIDDIEGCDVYTYRTKEESYAEAIKKLENKENVNYRKTGSLSNLASKLTGSDDKIVFVSEAHYTAIGESDKNFKSNSRILYTVKILTPSNHNSKAVDVLREPFNIYVSGLDTFGKISKVSRTDVNMVLTVNPKTHQVLITSIPRDAYITMRNKDGVKDKLTHTGIYGIDDSIGAVEDMLNIEINYYVKVNYSTVTKLVDAIGGIDVVSDYTFNTHGMSAKYLFYKGQNHLDGSMALAFARERKSFTAGDLQRNKNQQIVMEAIMKKALSSKTILTSYSGILSSIENNVETNFTTSEIQQLIKMQLKEMPDWSISKNSVEGTAGSAQCYSTGEYYVAIVNVEPESAAEATAKINEVCGKEQ